MGDISSPGVSRGVGISRAFDGTFGIGDGGVSESNPLPIWTIAYDGLTTFGQLTAPWIPTGNNWVMRFVHILDNVVSDRVLASSATTIVEFLLPNTIGAIRYVFVSDSDSSANGVYTPFSLHRTSLDSSGDVVVDGNLVIDQSYTMSIPTGISNIGKFSTDTLYYLGQIHRVELIDNDTPANSIVINAIVRSETQPTDFTIYNELTGLAVGAYVGATYVKAERV